MKWFKFYGQDWLTDTKIISLRIEERLCFLTLLCLASTEDKGGQVSNCDEEMIIRLTQLYENPYDTDNEVSRARGFLKNLENMGMITMITNDNTGRYSCVINKFQERQSSNLTGYERVKKYRENQKNSVTKPKSKRVINDNVGDVIKDNARIDKNRIEKNIHNIQYGELKKVSLSSEEYTRLVDLFGQTGVDVLIFELDTYIASSGKKYKSHYATLLNWAKRKFDQKQLQTKGRGLAI